MVRWASGVFIASLGLSYLFYKLKTPQREPKEDFDKKKNILKVFEFLDDDVQTEFSYQPFDPNHRPPKKVRL